MPCVFAFRTRTGEDDPPSTNVLMHLSIQHWREALASSLERVTGIDSDVATAPSTLRGLSGRRLASIDESLRRFTWKATLPGGVWPLLELPPEMDRDAQLFCTGCHADGHLREHALRLTQERPGHLATALVLIRCDDWVEPVRRTAEARLRQIAAADPGELFAHLELLFLLLDRQRIRAGAWNSIIEPALSSPERSSERWRSLEGGSSRHRRFMCELILRADPHHAEALALRTLQHPDPVIATWGIRELPRLSGFRMNDTLLAHALRHPHASVRAHALRARAHNPDETYRTLVKDCLFDSSASVRSVAAYACHTLGLTPKTYWREALDHDLEPNNRYALLGLSDSAEPGDLARIVPWLQHPTGELRCAALRAAVAAGIDDPASHLRDSLASPSSKVVGLALKIGAAVPLFISRQTLAEAFVTAANAATRARIVNATRQLDRWTSLDCLLDCIDHDDHAPSVLDALHAWHAKVGNRYAPALAADRKAMLLQRIDAMTPLHMHIAWLPVRRVIEAG